MNELASIDERLRHIEERLAGLPCATNCQLIGEHQLFLHGQPGEAHGVIARVGALEIKADTIARWQNALWGVFAGLIVSLASAGAIAVVTHLVTVTPPAHTSPPAQKSP